MAIAQLVLEIFVPQVQKKVRKLNFGKKVLKSASVEKQNKEQHMHIT